MTPKMAMQEVAQIVAVIHVNCCASASDTLAKRDEVIGRQVRRLHPVALPCQFHIVPPTRYFNLNGLKSTGGK